MKKILLNEWKNYLSEGNDYSKQVDYVGDMIKKIENDKTNIDGWQVSWEYPGFAYWYHDELSEPSKEMGEDYIFVAATPYWEEDNQIAVEVQTGDGQGQINAISIPYKFTGDIDKDAEEYINIMKNKVFNNDIKLASQDDNFQWK